MSVAEIESAGEERYKYIPHLAKADHNYSTGSMSLLGAAWGTSLLECSWSWMQRRLGI